MSAQLFYLPFRPVFNSTGLPAGAAQAYFFLTGTNTLAPIYVDSGLTQRLNQPVRADALGKLPPIYMDGTITYRVRITDILGANIGDDIDPYVPGSALIGPTGPPGGSVGLVGLTTSIDATQTLPAGVSGVRTSGYSIAGTGIADYAVVKDHGQAASPFIRRYANAVVQIASARITAEQAGALPTDADCGGTITDATTYLSALGGGCLVLSQNVTYNVSSRPPVIVDGNLYSYGCILPAQGVDMHSDNATVTTNSGTNLIGFLGVETGRTSFAYTPFTPGQVDFNVGADIGAYAAGTWVLGRFGDVPYDKPETANWTLAKVMWQDITNQTIRIDRPLERSWANPATRPNSTETADTRNHQFQRLNLTEGRRLSGTFRIKNSVGLDFTNERCPHIDTIIADQPGAGALIGQYCEQGVCNNLIVTNHTGFGGNDYGCRFAEASFRINTFYMRGSHPSAMFAEDACDISVGHFEDINLFNLADNPGRDPRGVIGAQTNCRIHFDNYIARGYGQQELFGQFNGSVVTADRVVVATSSAPNRIFAPAVDANYVALYIGDAAPEIYNGTQAFWREWIMPIQAGGSAALYAPAGYVAALYGTLEGGAAPADITYASWGRTSTPGSLSGLLSQEQFNAKLLPNWQEANLGLGASDIGNFGAVYGGANNWMNRASPTFLNVNFASGATAAAGKQLRVRMLIVPATTTTEPLIG